MGGIWMTAARLGTLADDADTWSAGGNILDGLQYDRIVGPVDAASRLAWLYSQQPDQLDYRDFAPQPWEHVIRVLRDMGHPHAAAEIAMAKQVQMRKAGKIGKWGTWRELGGWSKAKSLVQNGLHWIYGALAGYGYRPLRTVGCMLALWVACSAAFYAGRDGGYFGPTSAAIEINPKFAECGAPGDLIAPRTRDPKLKVQPKPMPKAHWTAAACPLPPEYTSFQPAMYSLDLILPVVNLQQDGDWAPIVSNARGEPLPWGQLLRALVWFEILFGWVATLVVAAVLGNLVKKD